MLISELSSERKRLRGMYNNKRKEGFTSVDAFVEWYLSKFKEQNGCCAYCETHINLIRQIIDAYRTSKTIFHQLRKVGNGGIRGYSLEIEKRDPDGIYAPENCSLVCYFCNNDKSYVYTEHDYKKFFGPARKRHFEDAARRLNITAP